VRNTRTSPECAALVLRVARRCTKFPPKPGATLSRLARVPGTVEEVRTGHYDGKRCQRFETTIFFLFVTCCFVPGTLGSQANTPSAKIEGTVFVRDSAGNQSFASGATVRLDGAATLEAETDANGKYAVAAVPFGTYTVEVALPGLKALRTVQVEDSEVRLHLEQKPWKSLLLRFARCEDGRRFVRKAALVDRTSEPTPSGRLRLAI
jgi:Carboxypeptidase regulatory-like domain